MVYSDLWTSTAAAGARQRRHGDLLIWLSTSMSVTGIYCRHE